MGGQTVSRVWKDVNNRKPNYYKVMEPFQKS